MRDVTLENSVRNQLFISISLVNECIYFHIYCHIVVDCNKNAFKSTLPVKIFDLTNWPYIDIL